MLHLRITTPSDLTERVLEVVDDDPAVSSLAVLRTRPCTRPATSCSPTSPGRPPTRSSTGSRPSACRRSAPSTSNPSRTWISQAGFAAEQRTPGSSADAVVWAEVTQRAYEESELNWTYLSFMTLATLLASIAIVVDSQILVIGAMVLGPEFVAIAALGLALVRRRPARGSTRRAHPGRWASASPSP